MISNMEKNKEASRWQDAIATRFVLFTLDGEDYCVPVLETLEVIAEYQITPMPTLPDRFEGVLSLRGEPVPVLNLRRRFSLPPKKSDGQTRVIIVETQQSPVGIEVDQVKRVISLNSGEIGPAPAVSDTERSNLIAGMAELEKGRFASILRVATILNNADSLSKASLQRNSPENPVKVSIPADPHADIHSTTEINS